MLISNKTVSFEFQNYEITRDGLEPRLVFPDRRSMCFVRDNFFEHLDQIHQTLKNDPAKTVIISLFSTMWVRSVMRAIYTSHQLSHFEAHNYKVECEDRFPFLSAALRGQLPPNDWYIEELIEGPARYPLWRWPLRLIRQLAVRPAISSSPGGSTNFDQYNVCLGTGFLIERHAQLTERPITHIDASYWFGPFEASLSGDQTFKERLMQAADNAAKESGIELVGIAREWLDKQFQLTVSAASYHLNRLKEHQHIPMSLWSGSSSFVWERMLAAEVMRRGGSVTAHDHGSGAGGVGIHMPYMLKGLCTEFFTFNSECELGLAESFRRFGFRDAPTPVFTSLSQLGGETNEEQNTVPIENAPARATNNKSVLIIPSNLVGEHMHLIPYAEDVPKLDFIVRLTAFLANRGYDVTLKPHPAYPFPEKADFSSIGGNVDIDTRRFEDIVDEYGMVIYGHPRTTTLKWAIDNKRPCIVLNPVPDGWTEEEKDLYSKFMMFLDIPTDDVGRLNMDWDLFENALSQVSPERQNN